MQNNSRLINCNDELMEFTTLEEVMQTLAYKRIRETIPLIRPHQCDSEGGRIRGVLLDVLNSTKSTF